MTEHDPFAGPAIQRVAPTTEPQREIWLAAQLGREASLAYNESIVLRLRGALDRVALAAALQSVVARHDALRATFSGDGTEMLISDEVSIEVPVADFSGSADSDAQLADRCRAAVETVFDLERGPLLRAELVHIAANDHALVITAHHIVCDGWSFGVLLADLAAAYTRIVARSPLTTTPAPSYADFALAQRNAGRGGSEDARYWLDRFGVEPAPLDLPTDASRPPVRSFASRREDVSLDATLVARLKQVSAAQNAGLFAGLVAVYAVLLHRLTGQDDIVIGVPAASQSEAGLDRMVGHGVNLLPLRIAIDRTQPFVAFVRDVQRTLYDALEHQSYTYGTLLKELATRRDASRPALVSVMLNLDQRLTADALAFHGLDVGFASNPRSFEIFDWFLNAVPSASGALSLENQYASSLIESATMQRWLRCLRSLAENVGRTPEARIDALDILAAEDAAALRVLQPASSAVSAVTLLEALQDHADQDGTAVRTAEAHLTYRELQQRADRIAQALRRMGARRGTRVAICMRRTPDMVATLLGIAKSGAAYVPLDPTYPRSRIDYMLADADVAVLAVDATTRGSVEFDAKRTLVIGDSLGETALEATTIVAHEHPQADDAAYLIYTSGSTGTPKGVVVPHRAVANFLHGAAIAPGLSPGSRLVAVTTLSFDIHVLEIWLTLARGGEIVLADRDTVMDGAALRRLLEESGATAMQATPAVWRSLIDAGWRGNMSFKALSGGEALPRDLAEALLERCGEVWNLYGPTETTVWSTARRVARDDALITIGQPLANQSVWVLDAAGKPTPVGVPGEIHIGGAGVTLGYWQKPALTAERFIPDLFSATPGAKLYRTGDRGRWRSDGQLEHLGRLDSQVKLHGYRIELGEIEAALRRQVGISDCTAIVREDRPDDRRLVAYVVAAPGASVDPEQLRSGVAKHLPNYMVPQHIVLLPTLPRLPNGKLDAKALPAPTSLGATRRSLDGPRDETERAIAGIFEAVLGLPGIGIHDDFFLLGGHSLLAAQLIARINREFALNVPLRALFESPTIATFAAAMRAARGHSPAREPIRLRPGADSAPLTLMQQRIWFVEQLRPGRAVYHLPSAHKLRGALDADALRHALNDFAARHCVLRTAIVPGDDGPIQRVAKHVTIDLPIHDLSAVDAAQREVQLGALLNRLALELFDFARAPLCKAALIRLSVNEHVLFFMAHHLVWDGWSFDVFTEEVAALYQARRGGQMTASATSRVAYRDFAVWHSDWLRHESFARQVTAWRERFADHPVVHALPSNRARHGGMSGGGESLWLTVDADATRRLRAFNRAHGVTMYMTTLGAYLALVYSLTEQQAMTIGTPMHGRTTAELERVVGLFTNLILLRPRFDPAISFTDLARQIKGEVLDALSFGDIPFEHLASELARGQDRTVLYQALFSYQNQERRPQRWGDLDCEPIGVATPGASEDLGLWLMERPHTLVGGLTYNSDLFDSEAGAAFAERYLDLLVRLVAQPNAPLHEILHQASPALARLERWRATASATSAQPARAPVAPISREALATPESATERQLLDCWASLLGVDAIGPDDNFFDLGGDSLLAMQAIEQIEAATGRRIEPRRYLFETVRQLAAAYDASKDEVAPVARKRGLFGRLFGSP